MNDGNIWLEFNVTGEKVIRTDNNRIAAGTRNTIKARFKMLDDWVGITPIAIFSKGILQKQVLTVNGECSVPNEFIRNDGHFSVCVYGGNFKTTVTEKSSIAVVKSGYTPDEELIIANGGDILSFVKTVERRVQFIRETSDGLFEYSLDGAVWKTIDQSLLDTINNTKVDKTTVRITEYYVNGVKLPNPLAINLVDDMPVVAADKNGSHFVYTKPFSGEQPYFRPMAELAQGERDDFEALIEELNKKVPKIAGKQLSTEDFLTAEKIKLANIADRANNYVHPTTHPASIIKQDKNNRFMTDAEKMKLNGIEAGANKYAHPTSVMYFGNGEILLNPFTVNIEANGIPVVAENDTSTHFVYSTPFSGEVPYLRPIAELSQAEREDFEALLEEVDSKVEKVNGKQLSTEDFTTAEKAKLAGIEAEANKYTHPTSVAYFMNEIELPNPLTVNIETNGIPVVAVDGLGSYFVYTKPFSGENPYLRPIAELSKIEVDNFDALLEEMDDKVDKEPGKQLMTNVEKDKLSKIADGANNYVHPTSHPASIITQDANNRFMTDAERNKLKDIAEGANKTNVDDTLTSTSKTNALSAAQGKVLNDIKLDIASVRMVIYSVNGVELPTPLTANLQANGTPVVANHESGEYGKYFVYAKPFSKEVPYLRPIAELSQGVSDDFDALLEVLSKLTVLS